MSGTEKFLFLGVVTLAFLVTSQVPDEDPDVPVSPPEATEPAVPTQPAEPSEPRQSILTLTPRPAGGYLKQLTACKGQAPSRGANIDENLVVTDYTPFVLAAGSVPLATAPVGDGCLSSLYGVRDGRLHKGVDYYNEDPTPVYAAGAGTIRRQVYRNDYGNMIVIDHGHGVYTRYAHLESFADPGEGDKVSAGEQIGIMGHTAGYTVPRHLHYEVLTGTWSEQAGSFALSPVDPLSLPEVRD